MGYLVVTPLNGCLEENLACAAQFPVKKMILIANVWMFFMDFCFFLLEHGPSEPSTSREVPGEILRIPEVSRVRHGEFDHKDVCYICLEEYTDGDFIARLPCYHAFHAQCCGKWLSNHVTCPLRCPGAVAPPVWCQGRAMLDAKSDSDLHHATDDSSQPEAGMEARQVPPDFNTPEHSTDVEAGFDPRGADSTSRAVA